MSREILGLPRNRRFILALSVAGLQSLSAVALLAASAWLISRAAEQPPVLYLMVGVVAVRAFALGRATFRYAERLLSHDGAFRQLGQIRVRLFEALVPFAPAGMGNQNRADAASRLVADVDELQNLPLRVAVPFVQVGVVSVGAVVGLSFISPLAATAMANGLVLALLTTTIMSYRFARTADLALAPQKAQLAANIIGGFERFELLQAYGWWQPAMAEMAGHEAAVIRSSKRSTLTAGVSQALISLLLTLSTIATGFVALLEFDAHPAVLLAVITLLPLAVFDVVSASQGATSAFSRYQASAKRVREQLERELPAQLAIASGTQRLESIESLELQDVAITYPGAQSAAVSAINLKLSLGETVLLRGPNGSGKSSIASLLVRFINPTEGRYLINSRNAEEFDADSIRARIGLIEQSPSIFSASVRANLLLAAPNASDDELVAVLKRVGLTSMLQERAGLDTELGDLGKLVSGGQAQRIALARALLADFDVLIFDEPSSNLDAENAQLLVADLLSIAKQSRRRAVLLISHDSRIDVVADRTISL